MRAIASNIRTGFEGGGRSLPLPLPLPLLMKVHEQVELQIRRTSLMAEIAAHPECRSRGHTHRVRLKRDAIRPLLQEPV